MLLPGYWMLILDLNLYLSNHNLRHMKQTLIAIALILSFTPLFAQPPRGSQWNYGAYYTPDGRKIHGFLAVDFSSPSLFNEGKERSIYFKAMKQDNIQELKARSVRAFIINNPDNASIDSFVVCHSRVDSSHIGYRYDFFKIMLEKGPQKLYGYCIRSLDGRNEMRPPGPKFLLPRRPDIDNFIYYYGTEPDSVILIDRKNFEEVMTKLMGDNAEIIKLIQNKAYNVRKINVLLKDYRSHAYKEKTE